MIRIEECLLFPLKHERLNGAAADIDRIGAESGPGFIVGQIAECGGLLLSADNAAKTFSYLSRVRRIIIEYELLLPLFHIGSAAKDWISRLRTVIDNFP